MKKFVDYIMAQPVWKVVLYGLGILLMIFNPEIILPLLFFGGIGFAWYFAKKKPNATKRNIAAIASVLAVGGAYLIDPNIASTKQEEQAQATHLASTPSKKEENAKKEAEAKREKEAKEKEEKEKAEKAEKEKKAKEEQERKEKEKVEKEKKAKEEQERKEKEEQDKKEAEAKQLAAQAESAVQALENNQVTENIAPAQAAIANVADQGTKDRLTHRVGLVQNAITVRAQQAEQARQAAAAEQARQAAAAQQAQQQQAQNQTVSGGGYYRDASGRWHRPNGQFASKKEIASIGLAW